MAEQTSYPLCWPEAWPRAKARTRAAFSATAYGTYPRKRELTIAEGANRVLGELKRMGVPDWNVIISTNVRVGLNGMPVSKTANPTDPGVAVYWRDKRDRQLVMAIDRYDRVADNLAAVAATIEAMRAIERHGGAQILERAFTGFAALPAPEVGQKPWREVLGFEEDRGVTWDQVERAYMTLRSAAHPDKGGTEEQFMAVQHAYDQAHRELRG